MSTPSPREAWDLLVSATADHIAAPTLAHELACQRALDQLMRSLGRGRPRLLTTTERKELPR